MSSPESKTCPSVVTTSRGIGGAWRNISVPTQPSTPKEHTKMAMNTSQSFFITSHSSRIGLVGKTCPDHTEEQSTCPYRIRSLIIVLAWLLRRITDKCEEFPTMPVGDDSLRKLQGV